MTPTYILVPEDPQSSHGITQQKGQQYHTGKPRMDARVSALPGEERTSPVQYFYVETETVQHSLMPTSPAHVALNQLNIACQSFNGVFMSQKLRYLGKSHPAHPRILQCSIILCFSHITTYNKLTCHSFCGYRMEQVKGVQKQCKFTCYFVANAEKC